MNSSIAQAFSQALKPKPNQITSCPCEECEELELFFAEFCPRASTVDDLRAHETVLIHGTRIAFRYLLQFFLEFSSRNLQLAGAIPDLIILAFSSDTDNLDRVGLLKTPEVECVRQYFDLLVEQNEYEEDELVGARKTLDRLNVWIELNKKS